MITMSKIDELAKIIGISSNIVFFGGAGMSTESGIPDFRSADGIYNQKLNKRFSPEQMVSHTFLMNYPEEFFEFLFNKMIFWEATPNKGHQALAELESRGFRGDNLVVINKTAIKADTSANLLIRESIGKVLSAAVIKERNGIW